MCCARAQSFSFLRSGVLPSLAALEFVQRIILNDNKLAGTLTNQLNGLSKLYGMNRFLLCES